MPHQVHEQEIISGTRGKGQGMEITLADKIKFYQLFIAAVVKLKWTEICHQIGALHHRLTYRASGSPKNVVVVGGSFAGAFLAQRLASTLPSTHRVILIEKNSHFHYLFNFPRYAVVRGREQRAFIPYSHLSSRCPQGIFEHVQDTVSQITSEKVELKSGKSVRFDFLAIATGTSRPPPANLQSTTKTAACAELQALQALVGAAKRIAVIGGGPVGVQTATDIKSTYPGKSVFLIHAHSRLLPGFGERVQNYATKAVKDMGITIFAGERPSLPKRIELSKGRSTLQFEDRPAENFDLVIPCFGQRANTSLIEHMAPSAISVATGSILTRPTLQLLGHSHLFALGDVAETEGPKMARAALSQAEVVCWNICLLIKGKGELAKYKPDPVERALKLSVGVGRWVLSLKDNRGKELLLEGRDKSVDMDARHAWKMLGADAEYARSGVSDQS